MKLYRSELIDYDNNFDSNDYIAFLDGLYDIIVSHEYEDDDRFVTYGRRDFLRQEFSDYLNDRKYSGRGKYNDALVDLMDFYSGNTWISKSSIPENMDFMKIDKDDSEYKKDGIVCKQEADIIKDMIDEFRNKIK